MLSSLRKWITTQEIFFFFLLALAIRIVWILNTDCALEGDSNARLSGAYLWANLFTQLPRILYLSILNPSVDWLPLHYYLNGLLLKITGNVTTAPRLLTAIFGAATILPLYKICLLKFNKQTATIATTIFTFYGAHILLSTQVMSEVYYLFFILYSLFFFESYLQTQQNKFLLLLSISLLCCTLLRYEGWLYCLLLLSLLILSKKWVWRQLLFFTLLTISGMVFVMTLEFLQGYPPLYGVSHSDIQVAQALDRYGRSLFFQFHNLRYSFIPLYFIAYGYFVWSRENKNKSNLLYNWLPYILPLVPFLIKLCQFSITSQHRYLLLYMVPAIPFVAYFISEIFERFKIFSFYRIVTLGLFIVAANYSIANRLVYSNDLFNYPKGFLSSAAFAKTNIDKGVFFLDYGGNNNFNYWSVRSNYYIIPFNRASYDSILDSFHPTFQERAQIQKIVHNKIRYALDETDKDGITWKFSDFEMLVQQNEISHLLIFPHGILNNYLHFSKEKEVFMGATFKRVFSENGYQIYEILYPI